MEEELSDRHGESYVTVSGNIIKARLIGSFNRSGAEYYVRQVKQCVIDLGQQSFSMLIDDLALEGGTPAAFEVLNEYNEWMNEQRLVAKAIVIESLAQMEIIKARSPAYEKQNMRHFIDEASALKWLEEQNKLAES